MKLYYTQGACSLVVRIIINEIGLSCDYEAVDLKTKQTGQGEDFLKINSKGAVPTLELDNGQVLTENAVILQYLADKNNTADLLPNLNNFQRYRVLEWLNYIATEMHKTIGALFNPAFSDHEKEVFKTMIKNKLNYLNQHLANQPYLAGETFTLPDPYLYVTISWLLYFKYDLNQWPNLQRYFDTLRQRPSIHRSLVEENLI